mgnify:CR=1 FL=1
MRHYELRVEAERESQAQADDLSADAVRIGAPDVAPTVDVELRNGDDG